MKIHSRVNGRYLSFVRGRPITSRKLTRGRRAKGRYHRSSHSWTGRSWVTCVMCGITGNVANVWPLFWDSLKTYLDLRCNANGSSAVSHRTGGRCRCRDGIKRCWLVHGPGGGGGGGGYSPNMVNGGVPLKWVTFLQKIPKHGVHVWYGFAEKSLKAKHGV